MARTDWKIKVLVCGECSVPFKANHPRSKFCTKKCFRKNHYKKTATKRKIARELIKDKKKEYDRARFIKLRERYRQNGKRWRANNKAKNQAKWVAYELRKKNRTPKWLTKDDLNDISDIYKFAEAISKYTGVKHHVDHIIPLHGKNISGLHVPDNLQVIPASDNIRKGNKYECR